MPLSSWTAGATALLVCTAALTDVRWRRIPNLLTFPAIGLGLVFHLATAGWEGLFFSLSGAVLAPVVLALLHAGRGFGMGDLKLVAAIGAILGPRLGAAAVLVSAIAGGLVAAVWILKSRRVQVLRLLPFARRLAEREAALQGSRPAEPIRKLTIPYGVAISIGTFITLAASWSSGNASWLL